jgi:hypothetical protein
VFDANHPGTGPTFNPATGSTFHAAQHISPIRLRVDAVTDMMKEDLDAVRELLKRRTQKLN